jgi:Zn-dependent protease with chaperone function
VTRVAHFSREEVERARRYHRPIYWAILAQTVLGLTVLGALSVWTPGLDWPWPLATAALAALAIVATTLVRLPLAFWTGFVHERRYGLSTQSLGGWAVDRLKGLAVGLVLTAVTLIGLVWIARAFPSWWPVVAAASGALFALLIGYVAPVVLEPIFNRFTPLEEEPLRSELLELAERAGVPVSTVLVADASRRTKKVNAYVSGLGRTRRVVLWDTLLRSSEPRQVKLVVAHELGHRRERHVAKLTLLGMLGVAAFVFVLWLVLGSDVADPASVPLILLLSAALELLALPFSNWLVRRWERVADRFSLDLTGDREAFVEAHRSLALENLSDLDPPKPLYLLLFSHPTAQERLATAQ